jgi:tetratricopeptide (TPR) repeat protein
MKKLLIVPLFLSFLVAETTAQYKYDFNENCLEAYKALTSLRFTEARKYINREKAKNPQNNMSWYLDNCIDFLTIIISEDGNTYRNLKNKKEKILDRLEKGDVKSPYHLYCQSQYHFQWAVARIKFREYLPAVLEANKAYRTLEKNQDKFPDFLPNQVNLSLMHCLIGTIPDEFSWAKDLLDVRGTISQGLQEISKVLALAQEKEEYRYLQTECLFYISFIHINLINKKGDAIRFISQFDHLKADSTLHRNPLLIYALSRLYIYTGQNDKAIGLLVNRPKGRDYFPFYYLDYMTGVAKLNRLDKDAYKYLFSYVLNFRGKNYIKSAYQKLGWFYLINGNTVKYKEYMRKVTRLGDDLTEDDQQAEMEAEEMSPPNVKLLRARLLFDGGYYQKAIKEMDSPETRISLSDQREQLEYNYRLGRIYHEWGKTDKAIPCYQKTIEEGSQSVHYYAANAALKLGNIYEQTGQVDLAKLYYLKAQNMKNKEYRSSINQKAKAGINRLENR